MTLGVAEHGERLLVLEAEPGDDHEEKSVNKGCSEGDREERRRLGGEAEEASVVEELVGREGENPGGDAKGDGADEAVGYPAGPNFRSLRKPRRRQQAVPRSARRVRRRWRMSIHAR